MSATELSAVPVAPAAVPAALPAEVPPLAGRRGLSLRARIQLIVTALTVLFAATLLWQQIDATRRSVREEITGANLVATQLLQRVSWVQMRAGTPALLEFLGQLGRVRANDIILLDADDHELYHSPPPTYKLGRNAPAWFSQLVVPQLRRQTIALPGGGALAIEADPSRAILDGWDDLTVLAGSTLLVLLGLLGVVFWLVGRTLRPFPTILAALARIEQGELATRLPALPGREAGTIGHAINRMSAAVEGHLAERMRAFEAERSLAESRELARQIEHHMEQERREIARELHDELGQSVTAIRSLAMTLALRAQAQQDAQGRELAELIGSEASHLDDAMHGLIPRLAPLALDQQNLADCLNDLVAGARQRERETAIALQIPPDLPELDGDVALAAYRVAQEGLSNALRHSGAEQVVIRVATRTEAGDEQLHVSVSDDGRGLPEPTGAPGQDSGLPARHQGRYGLRGLRERVRALGGSFSLHSPAETGEASRAGRPGLRLQAVLPLRRPTEGAAP